ncbi:MAG: hypothetical protein AAEJ04_09585 [Planctomycetota bacterium]
MISLLLAPLAWLLMALGVFVATVSLARGGAVFAIARTLLVEAWRRGVLPVGGSILFAGLGLLPLLLSPSQSVESRLHTLLDYGQSWIAMSMTMLSLLMSCGSYCDEVVTGRIRWLVVRPAARLLLLPGKCFGILLALLVVLVPATVFLLLLAGQISDTPGLFSNPIAVDVVAPETLTVTDQEIDSYLALQVLEDPQGWGGLTPAEGRQRARSRLERLSRFIPMGRSLQYWFQYPDKIAAGTQMSIRPSLGRAHRSERARLRIQFGEESQELLIRNGERSLFDVPDSAIGSKELQVEMAFLGAVEEGVRIPSVIWNGADAIQLHVPAGSLISSLAGSQFLTWIRCGFIAALGLTVSTFLGLPVATLFVLSFLIAALGGGFSGAFDDGGAHFANDPRVAEPSRILIDTLSQVGEVMVQQLSAWNHYSTGGRVAAGENLALSEVVSGFHMIGLVWSVLTLLLGIWISSRQEHGLGRDR